jgi:hypothetical protein
LPGYRNITIGIAEAARASELKEYKNTHETP